MGRNGVAGFERAGLNLLHQPQLEHSLEDRFARDLLPIEAAAI
jgi:hypothetical protein